MRLKDRHGADSPTTALELVVDGHTSNEIAARLLVLPKGLDTYRSRLMLKLGSEEIAGLVKSQFGAA